MLRELTKLLILSLLIVNLFVTHADTTSHAQTIPSDIEIEVHIIGFGVDSSAEKQLREMSAASGGRYYSSSDSDDLTAVLGAAAGIDVSGTPIAPPGQTNIQEKEPNNNAETATRANQNGTISGNIGKHDSDYFIIKVNKAGEWIVNLSKAPKDFQAKLGVYPAAGGSWLKNHSEEISGNLIVDLPSAGQYILKVNEKNNKSSTESYTLTSTFTPAPDIAEPNNNSETAYPILANAPIRGSILPKSDVDYFIFDAPQSGEWTISIDEQPSNHQIKLGVYPAAGGSWFTDQSEKGDNKFVVDLPRSGPYILKVSEANNKRAVSGYKLSTIFAQSPDKFEPNNKTAIASTVPGTGEIIATILPKGDNDYFIFKTDTAGEWSITVATQPENWQINLGVYPANGGSWLSDRSEKGDNKLVVDLPKPGRYILKATESNNKRSILPYVLNTVFTSSGDSSEPNNTAAIAKPVSLNGTITASILPKGDHDYFAVEVTTPGQWHINITEQPQNMHIDLGVYPAKGGSLLTDRSDKGDNKLVVDLHSPGRYILRAKEANSKRSTSPYKLQMQFQ